MTVNTVNHEDVPEIGFTHNEITVNKVHQPTSYPGCLKVIIVMLIVFYKEFGEDSEFFNDCPATQKELEKSVRSGPRFLILLKNQKGPKNKTIVEELEKRTQSPLHPYQLYVHMKNQKGPKNKTIVEELGKRTRSPLNPYRLYVHMENQNGSKDETSLKELEGRALSAPEPNVMYSVLQVYTVLYSTVLCTSEENESGKWTQFGACLYANTDEDKHKDRDDDERPEKDPPSCARLPCSDHQCGRWQERDEEQGH